jgi:signal transduction histidine kinase
MSNLTLEEQELIYRIDWLIRLRWLAVIGVIFTVYFVNNLLKISLQVNLIYLIAIFIAIYNLIFFIYSKKAILKRISSIGIKAANRFANIQISVDLLALCVLIHFSGGVENPFIFYFIFHMIIASMLLTSLATYIQAIFATFIFTLNVLLEYYGILSHYHLENFVPPDLWKNFNYNLGVLFVFTSTLYISVYFAVSIMNRLRERHKKILSLTEKLEKKTRELEEVNEDLKKLDRLKTEFVSMASHELRGPLSSIQSLLKVILEGMVGEINEKQRELIERVENRVMALIALINDLLDFSRIRIGRIVQEQKPIQIGEILQKIISLSEEKAKEKNINLKFNISQQLPLIKADRDNMEQLFTNLIDNAIRYTLEGGEVNVSAYSGDDYVIVEISDTGIGIKEEDIPKIFETFYRADNARELQKIGTGLGLSIVKQIVEVHGGEIEVKSKIGEGSTFKVFLPKIKI